MSDYDFKQLTQSARDSNLADYFEQSAYTIQRHGAEVYIKEFPGLCVNVNTNKWYSHYEGVGGSNAIDCLVKVCGRDFRQAVRELTGQDVGVSDKPRRCMVFMERPWLTNSPNPEPPQCPEKLLTMPVRGENMRRLFAYFCKERKIPATIVEELVKANLLYQSAVCEPQMPTAANGGEMPAGAPRPPNAVFVHQNADGKVVGGEVQGINSFQRYKGLVAGTGDSVFMFSPTSAKLTTAYLFESGIDLLSYYALADKENLQGVSLVSMAGLKPIVPKRLQADGLDVLSFVDNDEAGRKFERDNGFERGSDVLERAGLKDWSDLIKCGGSLTVNSVIPETESPTTTKGGIRK
jgi:hypothetical protein